jgi:hypothetical protein
MTFLFGFLVTLTAQCTDLLWERLPETCDSGRKWLWLTLPSGPVTSRRHLRLLDWTRRAWGLATPIDFFLWFHFKPWFAHCQLILQKILLPVLLRQRQPGIFDRVCYPLLRCRRLFIEDIGCTFEHVVSIGNKLQLFSEYFSGFAWFPTSVRPIFMVRSGARTQVRYTVAWQ